MLEGVKVVELAAYIAGPAAAGMMADWGAEVVKIEAPGGDPIRWNRPPAFEGGSTPNFEFDNRGKRSIVVDYRRPEGHEVIRKLAREADVFITSLRPGALRRAQLDYQSLSAINPRLVYASVTGYGLEGPLADQPAFDVTAFWARSGLLGEMTPVGGSPPTGRPGTGDHATALAAALGVMTALVSRQRTGRGQLVETSLLKAGAYLGGFDIAEQVRRGQTSPAPLRGAEGVTSTQFATRSGRWIYVWMADPDRDWSTLCELAGCPALAADPAVASAEGRSLHGRRIMEILDAAFASLDDETTAAALDRSGLMWSPVQRASDVLEDPAAHDAGCFVEVDDGAGGAFRSPAPPVRFPGADHSSPKGAVPTPGQQTDAILRDLGYADAEIAALRTVGAVS
jgi:crotonobetainyl-CoA:carnitine CoA-transferase CaiB-like acyl-CoA transferase